MSDYTNQHMYADEVNLVWMDPETGAEVYIGSEAAVTPKFVIENGIRHIINANHESEREFEAFFFGAVYSHYPFLDAPPHEQLEGMKGHAGRAVADLVELIRAGKKTVVHCRAGVHRSPAIVYAALVILGRFENRYDAYCHVVKLRSWARLSQRLAKWVEHAGRDEMRYRQEGKQ